MLYSAVFGRTTRTYPKDEISINAKLLLKAGFIDKLMAGSYTLLPLGWRVKEKTEDIIRSEMNKTGASELLMPLMHPKAVWEETGRWESAKDVMYQLEKDKKYFALSFTHEEIVLDLIRKHAGSYKDLPIKIYHFSTKFRNETRVKSGLLRTREFIMKDLYSAHITKDDLESYYQNVMDAYMRVFDRLDLKIKITQAGGGVFTKEYTHEFQMLSEAGEDTVFYCDNCDFAQNEEIFKENNVDKCPNCKNGKILTSKAIELGNTFPLGTWYAEKMNVFFTDKNGSKKPLWLASYGIGVTRVIGAIVEAYHDGRGIVWPEAVAPYQVHLIGLDLQDKEVKNNAYKVYGELKKSHIEVLFDDRKDLTAGEKFADADLIGIPHRLVVSKKTGDKIEFKKRNETESKLFSLDQILKR